MDNDKAPQIPDWDLSVPPEVEQAARAAEYGGMKPNTSFRRVLTRERYTKIRPKNMQDDDPYWVVTSWHCDKPLQVHEEDYLYQYLGDSDFGPICLVYGPVTGSP